jgi:hypothetical protein
MATCSGIPFLRFYAFPRRITQMGLKKTLMALVQPGLYCKMSRFSRLWRGLEQTASFLAKRVFIPAACCAACIKTIGPSQDSGAERYGNVLHGFGQVNFTGLISKYAQNAAKESKNA